MVNRNLSFDPICRLPCWWGISPGQTSLNEAVEILSVPALSMVIHRNNREVFLEAKIPMDDVNISLDNWQFYRFMNDISWSIEVFTGIDSEYQIGPLLESYGPPNEIWITTFNRDRMGAVLFFSYLFYPDLGLISKHEFRNAYIENETIFGCPGPNTYPRFYLFEPSKFSTLEGALTVFDPEANSSFQFLKIEDSSDLTIDDFYNMFIEYEGEECILTATAIWPPPN